MNTLEENILNAAEQIDPNAPIVQVAENAVKTAADPNVANIVADLELVISLIKEFKAKVKGMHPTIGNLLKELI